MIIIEQNFNKVPLCLEGTKENSPFTVSGPALVVVVVVSGPALVVVVVVSGPALVVVAVSGITPVLFFGKMNKIDVQENDPDQMQTWQWTWLRGRGNM